MKKKEGNDDDTTYASKGTNGESRERERDDDFLFQE